MTRFKRGQGSCSFKCCDEEGISPGSSYIQIRPAEIPFSIQLLKIQVPRPPFQMASLVSPNLKYCPREQSRNAGIFLKAASYIEWENVGNPHWGTPTRCRGFNCLANHPSLAMVNLPLKPKGVRVGCRYSVMGKCTLCMTRGITLQRHDSTGSSGEPRR